MKYIITEEQYKKLISEQGYGDIINIDSKEAPVSNKASYGDISTLEGGKIPTATSSAKTTTDKIDIFADSNLLKKDGSYTLKGMKQLQNKTIQIDFSSFKATTDCERIKKGDFSFDYSNTKKYSKDLAKKVGEKFGCKFPS